MPLPLGPTGLQALAPRKDERWRVGRACRHTYQTHGRQEGQVVCAPSKPLRNPPCIPRPIMNGLQGAGASASVVRTHPQEHPPGLRGEEGGPGQGEGLLQEEQSPRPALCCLSSQEPAGRQPPSNTRKPGWCLHQRPCLQSTPNRCLSSMTKETKARRG